MPSQYLIEIHIFWKGGMWWARSSQMPQMNFCSNRQDVLMESVHKEVARKYGGESGEYVIRLPLPEKIDEADYMAVGDDGLGW